MASLEDWNFTIKLYPRGARNLTPPREGLKGDFLSRFERFGNQPWAGSIPVWRA